MLFCDKEFWVVRGDAECDWHRVASLAGFPGRGENTLGEVVAEG